MRGRPAAGGRPAARVVFGLVVLASLVVLFTPGSDVPSHVPISDKIIHATLFAALAVTGLLAGVRRWPLALALVVYAVASEVLQAVLPIHRDGDWHDSLADTIGTVLGLAVTTLALRLRRVGA